MGATIVDSSHPGGMRAIVGRVNAGKHPLHRGVAGRVATSIGRTAASIGMTAASTGRLAASRVGSSVDRVSSTTRRALSIAE